MNHDFFLLYLTYCQNFNFIKEINEKNIKIIYLLDFYCHFVKLARFRKDCPEVTAILRTLRFRDFDEGGRGGGSAINYLFDLRISPGDLLLDQLEC